MITIILIAIAILVAIAYGIIAGIIFVEEMFASGMGAAFGWGGLPLWIIVVKSIFWLPLAILFWVLDFYEEHTKKNV